MLRHAGASDCLCGCSGLACHRRHPSVGRIAGERGPGALRQGRLEPGCALISGIRRQPARFCRKNRILRDLPASRGGRKDVFHWAAREAKPGETPVAELEIYRPGGELAGSGPAVTELARRMHPQGLSRLILLTAGNDPKLAELFARAELKRASCTASATSAALADWVTDAGNPRLRGRL